MVQEAYMKLALELAEKGKGFVNPNPMVGAVIVKNNSIIGSGYHQAYGQLHAERNALASVTESPAGATMYVNLEPCCHYGKTPPCTEAILESGISHVVVGTLDPNPKVSGNGVRILEQHGVKVTVGVLEKESRLLNKVFIHYITTKRPFLVLKSAMTIDGKTATSSGESQWITNDSSRKYVHQLRHNYSAIMTGVQTVITDNPLLTCRLPDAKNPVRIICDTHLRIPLSSKIVETAHDVPTYIATACEESEKGQLLRELGCNMIYTPLKDGVLDLSELVMQLGKMKIDSILLEGGPTLNFSALKDNLVDYIYLFIAPKILGGTAAKTPVGGTGVERLNDYFSFRFVNATTIDSDILLEYEK
ncbi:bifunctional diaminohydroxyphosphoribosylaminopyrimidine deaminase/5-amino-6-(5-phosphoribosylamino)uracil reductase RibD [Anaeromicropila populeti]|uniref:Riboflavin biosynthesis protein RibD n=1 Tax=Anaeromicropila populeti TaxID=37658 RepID=A0A1I6JQ89_9FIRM|nr:bifunctional diaminohydroxyphosphoribosylaminopyrimidine deaminase/5-amino-6-(5-phosphoribosylamino)uracil reductase RibD [Anaeromicropila populeti]SFR81152.1 diaminohydroxyphosphoribosylaminopyrimidine deaminase / 5-amino-6-(5-phosphoribosylamino)uracil reductase [Anaeromicropila populeti]